MTKKVAKKSDEDPQSMAKETSIDVISWDELPKRVATPEVVHVQYSNSFHIQASSQDVFIDFQELPGHIRDGKLSVNVTRIYLTIDKSRSLAEAINGMLKAIDEQKN